MVMVCTFGKHFSKNQGREKHGWQISYIVGHKITCFSFIWKSQIIGKVHLLLLC